MLTSITKLFRYYRSLGEGAMSQLNEEQCMVKMSDDGNSVANIVKHLHGNMLSRWTDFLSSDGEKAWRDRDGEFEDTIRSKEEMMIKWKEGWDLVLSTLDNLSEADLDLEITIRGESHSAEDAILRQFGHYASHVGQIIFIARNLTEDQWQTLSIPKGQSKTFNEKFAGRIKDQGKSIWER